MCYEHLYTHLIRREVISKNIDFIILFCLGDVYEILGTGIDNYLSLLDLVKSINF